MPLAAVRQRDGLAVGEPAPAAGERASAAGERASGAGERAEPAGAVALGGRTEFPAVDVRIMNLIRDAPMAETAAALLAVLLYLPSLGYGFVFDDLALISADGSPVALGGILPYRPLRYASYLFDRWLGGSAAIYHADNVLLHALVAALVVALARRLGIGRRFALFAGLLVAAHPLAVEAAAYVAGRRDLLCVAFGLLALLAHRSGRLGAAAAMLVLSVAAKESGLVFAAPLVAMTLAGAGRPGPARRPARDSARDSARGPDRGVARSAAPGVARRRPARGAPRAAANGSAIVSAGAITAAAAAGLALAFSYGAIGPWAPSPDATGLALPGRVAAHYAAGVLGLHALGPEYPQLLEYVARVRAGNLWAACGGAMAGVLLLATAAASVAACVRAGRRQAGGETAFLFAWTMATLAALAVWGGLHEPGADRHAYLLLPPLAISLAALLSHARLARPFPRRATFACAALLVPLLAAGSRAQMEVWRSDRTLWTHAASRPSPSPRTHSNLARVLAHDGNYAAATHHLNLAIAADPADPLLYLGRAAVSCAQHRPARARRDLQHARVRGAPSERIAELAGECPVPVLRATTEHDRGRKRIAAGCAA